MNGTSNIDPLAIVTHPVLSNLALPCLYNRPMAITGVSEIPPHDGDYVEVPIFSLKYGTPPRDLERTVVISSALASALKLRYDHSIAQNAVMTRTAPVNSMPFTVMIAMTLKCLSSCLVAHWFMLDDADELQPIELHDLYSTRHPIKRIRVKFGNRDTIINGDDFQGDIGDVLDCLGALFVLRYSGPEDDGDYIRELHAKVRKLHRVMNAAVSTKLYQDIVHNTVTYAFDCLGQDVDLENMTTKNSLDLHCIMMSIMYMLNGRNRQGWRTVGDLGQTALSEHMADITWRQVHVVSISENYDAGEPVVVNSNGHDEHLFVDESTWEFMRTLNRSLVDDIAAEIAE